MIFHPQREHIHILNLAAVGCLNHVYAGSTHWRNQTHGGASLRPRYYDYGP
jgi:hypothetical protein